MGPTASRSTVGKVIQSMMMVATLISVKVTGMAMRQSQRSDKERLKIRRFLSK